MSVDIRSVDFEIVQVDQIIIGVEVDDVCALGVHLFHCVDVVFEGQVREVAPFLSHQ